MLKQRFEHGSSVVFLRSASSEDECFLAGLYATTREEDLRLTDWDDVQKAAFCTSQFQLQQLDYAANYPADGHLIILRDDAPIGRVWIAEQEDCFFLVDISLLPDHRRGGVGTLVMKQIFDAADRRKLPVRLTSFRTNPRAIAFFERLGFHVHAKDEMLVVLERPVELTREPQTAERRVGG